MKVIIRFGALLALLLAVPALATIVTPEVIVMDQTGGLQAAIDATPAGGILNLPTGEYVAPAAAGWLISKRISIRGAGIGSADDTSSAWGTILRPYHGDTDTPDPDARVFTILQTGGVYISDLTIANMVPPNTASSNDSMGCGILVDNSDNKAAINSVTISRVAVHNVGGWGIRVDGGDGSIDRSVNNLRLEDIDLASNKQGGLNVRWCAAPSFTDVYSHDNGIYGMWLEASSLSRVISCYFENNGEDATDATYQAQVRADGAHSTTFLGCGFEQFYRGTNKTGLTLNNCYGVTVTGCSFSNWDTALTTCSIRMVANTRGTVIGPNTHSYVNYAVRAAESDGIEGTIVEQQILLHRTAGNPCPGEVAIPTAANSFNFTYGRASNDGGYKIRGLRLPALTGIDGDTKDAAAYSKAFLMFDDVDKRFKYYDGNLWMTMKADTLKPQP